MPAAHSCRSRTSLPLYVPAFAFSHASISHKGGHSSIGSVATEPSLAQRVSSLSHIPTTLRLDSQHAGCGGAAAAPPPAARLQFTIEPCEASHLVVGVQHRGPLALPRWPTTVTPFPAAAPWSLAGPAGTDRGPEGWWSSGAAALSSTAAPPSAALTLQSTSWWGRVRWGIISLPNSAHGGQS